MKSGKKSKKKFAFIWIPLLGSRMKKKWGFINALRQWIWNGKTNYDVPHICCLSIWSRNVACFRFWTKPLSRTYFQSKFHERLNHISYLLPNVGIIVFIWMLPTRFGIYLNENLKQYFLTYLVNIHNYLFKHLY